MQTELYSLLREAKNDIINNNLYEGIKKIDKVLSELKAFPNQNFYDTTKETFEYLLSYFAKDVADERREITFIEIQKKLIIQVDKLVEHLKSINQNNYNNIYSSYHQKADYISGLGTLENDSYRVESVFMQIWLTDLMDTNQVSIIRDFMKKELAENSLKCQIISALSLSLFRFFDVNKILILFDTYMQDDTEVKYRALVGIVISLLLHEKILVFYPEIKQKLKETEVLEGNSDNFEYAFLQLIKSMETDKIMKEFRSDIMPHMKELEDTVPLMINIDELPFENLSTDDENPHWQDFFEQNSSLLEKMDKFTRQQFDGLDVFSATIGNMKNYSFFRKASNWFMPFRKNNKFLKQELENKVDNKTLDSAFKLFEKTSYFCNSDKYSFCFNMPSLNLKGVTLDMIISEIENTQEFVDNEDDFKHIDKQRTYIIHYFQDLYRFYNFNKDFTGFSNIFKSNIGIHNSDIFAELSNYDNILRSCAELSFSRKTFANTALIFEKLQKIGENNADIYEKTAFSYQKLNDFENALKNYLKAELFDYNKKWLFKKIGFAYIKLSKYDKALEYYKQIAETDPDDTSVLSLMGHCNIALNRIEEAKKIYFKLNFYKPDDHKVLRAIAVCYFSLKEYDKAKKYFLNTINIKANKLDFIYLGHILWIEKNKIEAIKYYSSALNEYEDFDDFKSDFYANKATLSEHNINDFEIIIMVSFLNSKFSQ